MTPRIQEISGAQKAAILMVLLGDKAAGSVCRHLPQQQVAELTRAIAQVDYVSRDLALQILDEFRNLSLTRQAARAEAVCLKDPDQVQATEPQQLAEPAPDEKLRSKALHFAAKAASGMLKVGLTIIFAFMYLLVGRPLKKQLAATLREIPSWAASATPAWAAAASAGRPELQPAIENRQ